MPYITVMQSKRHKQISLDEILSGEIDVSYQEDIKTITGTRTYSVESINEKTLGRVDIQSMIDELTEFNTKHKVLCMTERRNLYRTFFIPKRSGGLRKIDAPNEALMGALRDLKKIFEVNMFALYHTSAFAYVRGRCTLDAVKKHQQNGSRWFLKTDFSNFFGSTTESFVLDMFSRIFPFSEVVKIDDGKAALQIALNLCFLDGGLPQGTPISPTITNIMMIPIDHMIYNEMHRRGNVYTRYADDILISNEYSFDFNEVQAYVNTVLSTFDAPFKIKPEKTRYGSSAGRNWNLGVMLNKDNNITIGYQKKKQFKAMCCNYINDRKNNVMWDKHDVQVFAGLIAYYKMVERDGIARIIAQYNEKFSVNLMALIHEDLRCH